MFLNYEFTSIAEALQVFPINFTLCLTKMFLNYQRKTEIQYTNAKITNHVILSSAYTIK